MNQILLNLMSNAIKYNRQGGCIIITLTHKNDKVVRLSVTDEGEGLSQYQQSQLFQPFNRLGAEQTSIEGAGIGLVITQKLSQLMGGGMLVWKVRLGLVLLFG